MYYVSAPYQTKNDSNHRNYKEAPCQYGNSSLKTPLCSSASELQRGGMGVSAKKEQGSFPPPHVGGKLMQRWQGFSATHRQACSSHCNLDSRIGRRQCCLATHCTAYAQLKMLPPWLAAFPSEIDETAELHYLQPYFCGSLY